MIEMLSDDVSLLRIKTQNQTRRPFSLRLTARDSTCPSEQVWTFLGMCVGAGVTKFKQVHVVI